jgi:hypothetical protein
LDISVIDSVTDFYVVSVVFLNECSSKDFINGIAPMTASYTDYTLVFKHYYQTLLSRKCRVASYNQ